MKVKELVEELQELPLDVEVVFDVPEHDLWDLQIKSAEYDKTEHTVHLTSEFE